MVNIRNDKNEKSEEPLLPLGVALLNSVGEFAFCHRLTEIAKE
jgi:hypothetical protein